MESYVNQCMLSGKIIKNDPVLKTGKGGNIYLSLFLAVDSEQESMSGETYKRSDYAIVVFRGDLAKRVSSYKKGDFLSVKAHFQTRSYEKNSEKRYITEFIATDFS